MPGFRKVIRAEERASLPPSLLCRWRWVILYIILIFATLPLLPVVWIRLARLYGRAPGLALTALLAAAALALFLYVVRVKGERRPWVLGGLVGLLFLYGWEVSRLTLAVERVHFLEYGLLSFLVFRVFQASGKEGVRGWWLKTLAFTFAVGVLDEVIQYILPNRVGDLRDVLLNAKSGLYGLVATALIRDRAGELWAWLLPLKEVA
ncbi:MAG: VanZ family protein [Nitrospinota bacterium]